MKFVTILCNAEETENPSKTGEFDISLPLDLERQRTLAAALVALIQGAPQDELLWPISYQMLLREFKTSVEAIGAGCLRPCLHSLRHGGASTDRCLNARTLLEVQQRGAWRAFGSVRRYEKHGRLLSEMRKLPARVRRDLVLKREKLESGSDGFFGDHSVLQAKRQLLFSSTDMVVPAGLQSA